MSTKEMNNELEVDCFTDSKLYVVSNKMKLSLPAGAFENCVSTLEQIQIDKQVIKFIVAEN